MFQVSRLTLEKVAEPKYLFQFFLPFPLYFPFQPLLNSGGGLKHGKIGYVYFAIPTIELEFYELLKNRQDPLTVFIAPLP